MAGISCEAWPKGRQKNRDNAHCQSTPIPFLYRQRTWPATLALALAAGLLIEGAQVALFAGMFDIDDLILSGLGVILGSALHRPARKKRA